MSVFLKLEPNHKICVADKNLLLYHAEANFLIIAMEIN